MPSTYLKLSSSFYPVVTLMGVLDQDQVLKVMLDSHIVVLDSSP
jgi:hypothetical protein